MATYGQLLLGSGGGVIDHNKQSARQAGATLIIGLGGTGGQAVQMIKREVYRQLKPDDPDAEIPEYSNIRYLIVDTDPSDYSNPSGNPADIDGRREFFNISYDAIAKDFAKENYPMLARDNALSWLNYENINPDTAKAGAGGVRQVGRYLLVKNSFDFYSRLETEIQLAMKGNTNGDLTVHICAGISGGTGSGTFLDTCYLVRRAINNLGIRGAEVCGYFFLPDVNLTVPAIMADPTIQAYVKVNGYAAMQELDYCMNYDKNNDSFKMNYGNGITVDDAGKPVDLCYLISATNQRGQILDKGYSYALNVVTDHVISFLSRVELPEGVAAGNDGGLTLAGHIANIKRKNGQIQIQSGAAIDYNILGASVAEMPLSEIATYLGVKLFDNIEGIYNRVPTKAERDGFQKMLRMTYEDIFREMMKDCTPEIPFGKRYDGSLLKDKGVGPYNMLHNETYDHNCGIMERNARTMMEDLGDFRVDSDAAGTSLISRIFKELYERCVINAEYGPFYAKRMLYGSNNEDLYKAVLGLIEQNRERIKSEAIQEDHLREDLEDAKQRAASVNFMNANSRAEDLQNALTNYCMHMCRTTAFEKIDKVLIKLRDQMAELDSRLFTVLTTIMENLRDTFRENAKVFSEGIQDEHSYTWKILSITEVASQLDETIQNMDVRLVLLNMMKNMFSQVDRWAEQQDDNKICKLVSDFILDEFRSATQKTMTDYLHIRFKTNGNIQLLAKAIDENIMHEQLWGKATPLFWQNPQYNATIGQLSTLSIPYDSQPIELASQSLASTQGVSVRKTEVIDKISLMRFLSGIPMYAYQGLGQLELAYELDHSAGRHLFETAVNWNEMLPSPIPNSRENGTNERQFKKNKDIEALWNKAKAAGILKADEFNMWHVEVMDIDVAGLETDFNAIAAGDAQAMAAFGEKVNAAKASAGISNVSIRLTSVENGYEEIASLDNFVRAPRLVELVKAEVEKREKVDALIAKASDGAASIVSLTKIRDDFFNAVFTGVIVHAPMEAKYIKDSFGIKEDVILSNPTMTYGESTTYQAFLTYKELDADLRTQIANEAKMAMISSDEPAVTRKKAAMDFVSTKLEMLITSVYMGASSTSLIKDEVDSFYKEFMKAYQKFKLLNQ